MSKKEETKKNILYIVILLILFMLFVISGYIHEMLGMFMFGVLFLYSILGNHTYKAEYQLEISETDVKKFNEETLGIVIKVKRESADFIETMEIEGRKCFVIPVDEHLEVNGVVVKL